MRCFFLVMMPFFGGSFFGGGIFLELRFDFFCPRILDECKIVLLAFGLFLIVLHKCRVIMGIILKRKCP